MVMLRPCHRKTLFSLDCVTKTVRDAICSGSSRLLLRLVWHFTDASILLEASRLELECRMCPNSTLLQTPDMHALPEPTALPDMLHCRTGKAVTCSPALLPAPRGWPRKMHPIWQHTTHHVCAGASSVCGCKHSCTAGERRVRQQTHPRQAQPGCHGMRMRRGEVGAPVSGARRRCAWPGGRAGPAGGGGGAWLHCPPGWASGGAGAAAGPSWHAPAPAHRSAPGGPPTRT